MKIRTRLMMYNVMIIFISLFVMTIMIGSIINIFRASYYDIDNLVIDHNVRYIEEIVNNVETATELTDVESLEVLHNYGYELFVYKSNTLVYGNPNNVTSGVLTIVSNYEIDENTKTVFVDNATMVTKMVDNKLVIAVKDNLGTKYLGTAQTNFQIFFSRFIMLSIFLMIVVLGSASILSRKIIVRLMKPVELLTHGAQRIQNGNLEESIVYEDNDEFEIVIANFNEMQRHLKEEREKNRAFEKAKSEMIHGLSHDIRTPLTSVKGYIKGIQDGVANTLEKQNQYLSIAYRKTIDIEILLNHLFDAFNIEAIELTRNITNMSKFFDVYKESHKDEFMDRGINFDVHCPRVPIFANIDREQMVRVFNNFVGNSIKYAKVDELILSVHVWQEQNLVHITFKDNGIGVNSENISHLFDEFWRADGSRTSIKEGSGLGLYIIKSIVESHGGTIEARNENGLLFEIIIPGGEEHE